MSRNNSAGLAIFGLVAVVVLFIGGLMFGLPRYSVWQKEMAGKAELRQAEWNRQIRIKEAEAEHEAAKALAQAEIERAKGVAESNKIIGNSLQNNESYLRYIYLTGLAATQNQGATVVYVPTEAGLPILEASRTRN